MDGLLGMRLRMIPPTFIGCNSGAIQKFSMITRGESRAITRISKVKPTLIFLIHFAILRIFQGHATSSDEPYEIEELKLVIIVRAK